MDPISAVPSRRREFVRGRTLPRMERREGVDEESFPLGGSGGAAVQRGASASIPRVWPTVDGPLGAETEEKAVEYARSFFFWGFFCLPWLWAVNCFYFWPVLLARRTHVASSSYPFPRLRPCKLLLIFLVS